MFRKDIIIKLQGVEREYRAAALAANDLLRRSLKDPTVLYPADIVHADVRLCRDNSEATYLVRMFAVFEEALRDIRRAVFRKTGPIKTFDLLRQCGSRRSVPPEILADAHSVREFRNKIVHGGIGPAVTTAQARSVLCKFFARMPETW